MSRVSNVVFGSMVLAIVGTVAGCKVSVETKARFTETNVSLKDDKDWAGQPIVIDIASAGVIVNGGVNVDTADVTQITANARVLATAFKENAPDAQLSINDVKARFQMTHTDSVITISCPHGDTHGGSNGGESGCELTNIIVPQGTDVMKLSLEIKTGNGSVTVKAGGAHLSRLAANSKNSGDITASVGPSTGSVGADIALVGLEGGDVVLNVSPDFAADSVFLVADPGKVVSTAFPDLTKTDGTTGRGAVGTGFKSIKLTSTQFAGSSDKVTLQ